MRDWKLKAVLALLGVNAVVRLVLLAAATGPREVAAAQTRGAAAPAAGLAPARAGGLAGWLVERGGVQRGLCALLGAGDGRLAVDLAGASELLVHVQEPNRKRVEPARELADRAGLYGTRVVIEEGPWERLPYADNTLDLLIHASLTDDLLDGLAPAELLRVLRPGGKLLVGRASGPELTEARLREWLQGQEPRVASGQWGLWAELAKPAPRGTDEWTHWQHGPDNNPLSADRTIKAPYMTQFLAAPKYSTMPSISVISGGRMFRAAGHMAIHQREERYLNTLYATNAYNGTLLWTREIPNGFLVHRSLFVATPDALYLLDPEGCLVLDPATGEERDRLALPDDVTPDRYWKWIALADGTLYALLGGPENEAEVIQRERPYGAWGWDELSQGYYDAQYPWGYGQTVVAVAPQTKRVLWTHREETPIDSRALCLRNGRLFLHGEGRFVACLDTGTGDVRWRNEDPRLLNAIAEPYEAGLGFKTTPYALCTDEGLYFAGKGRKNVVGVAAKDGQMRWSIPGAYNATNMLFRDGRLLAHIPSCSMVDPLTGAIVKDLGLSKRSCARLTGCPEAIFQRGSLAQHGGEGTIRYDWATGKPTVIHAFRPPCNDGILPAEGLLHITPWDCDCNLQLMGSLALCPAGAFEFGRQATEEERLESRTRDPERVAAFDASERDWSTYRGGNERCSATSVAIPTSVAQRWEYAPSQPFAASSPVAAGGLVLVAGGDCQVRALEAATGAERWRFRTAGAVRLPPSVWEGRAYVGSCDGHIYALEAATGYLLWRFRVAPEPRRIPVFGALWSTWPVNSGVLVQDGVAYAVAGIINYDGTHAIALDATTGRIKWQNNSSGHLNGELREGVSVQGDLALQGGQLLLAGGNVTSPAAYALADGRCLTPPPDAGWPVAQRGCEVASALGRYTLIGGPRLFAQEDDPIVNWSGYEVTGPGVQVPRQLPGRVPPACGHGVVATSARDAQGRGPLLCADVAEVEKWLQDPNKDATLNWRWANDTIQGSVAVVAAPNAVIAAGERPRAGDEPTSWLVQAHDPQDGHVLWSVPLAAAPVPGGLGVDRDGRVIVVLEGGRVVCVA